MRWSIAIPQLVEDGGFDPAGFRAYLARAEALGFESGWTQEQVLGSASSISPLETMTYAAACTERLGLGCAVFVTPLHQPVHLAKSLASLDQLSRGRLQVGVGIGGAVRPFSAFEVEPDDGLVDRFNEGLAVMKALWTEPTITFAGRFWQLDGATMEPKPFQKPHPPVWFGGSAAPALRRAVRHGDGFFGAGSTTTAAFAEQVSNVRHELEQRQRDPGSFRDRQTRLHRRGRRRRAGTAAHVRRTAADLWRVRAPARTRRRHGSSGRLRGRAARRRGRRRRDDPPQHRRRPR